MNRPRTNLLDPKDGRNMPKISKLSVTGISGQETKSDGHAAETQRVRVPQKGCDKSGCLQTQTNTNKCAQRRQTQISGSLKTQNAGKRAQTRANADKREQTQNQKIIAPPFSAAQEGRRVSIQAAIAPAIAHPFSCLKSRRMSIRRSPTQQLERQTQQHSSWSRPHTTVARAAETSTRSKKLTCKGRMTRRNRGG